MVGTNLEVPAFIPENSLSKQFDTLSYKDPRQIISLIGRSVFDGNLEKQTGYKINVPSLGRRRFLLVTAAATGALVLPGLASADDDWQVYTNQVPWHSGQYFPLSRDIAGREGLLTLDEIGGPLHLYDIAEDLINNRKTDVRGWWEAHVTLPLLKSMDGYPQKLADAGYCSDLAATQIRIPNPSSSRWVPDEFKSRPDIARQNPDYSIESTSIIGLNVARFAGGVAYRPVEIYERPATYQSPEVAQVLDQFISDYQNPEIQDRLFVVEYKPNWYAKVDSVSDDGNTLFIENFDKNPKIIAKDRKTIIWAHKPYSLEDARMLKKLGLLDIPDQMMNERAPWRAPELRGQFIDFLGGNQLANAA